MCVGFFLSFFQMEVHFDKHKIQYNQDHRSKEFSFRSFENFIIKTLINNILHMYLNIKNISMINLHSNIPAYRPIKSLVR